MEKSENIGVGYKESHAYLEEILKRCSTMEPKYESPVYTQSMSITDKFTEKEQIYRNAKHQYKIYEFENGLEVLVNTIGGKNAGVIVANGHIEPLGSAYNGGYFLNDLKSFSGKLPETYITFTEDGFNPTPGPQHISINTPQFAYAMGNFRYMSFDEKGERQYDVVDKIDNMSSQNTKFNSLVESKFYADYGYAMRISGLDESGHLVAINDENFAGIHSQIRKGWAATKQNSELQKSYEDIYELYAMMEEAGKGERTTKGILEDITQDEINTAMTYVSSVNQNMEKRMAEKEQERLEKERRQLSAHEKEEYEKEEHEKELEKKRELIAKIREQQEAFLDNLDNKKKENSPKKEDSLDYNDEI